ncbi:chemotaxis protein CheD [Amphibacillus marinus]|uniref:Probable chemoreceptor glutamine deamidase CheD n=1 Tax=Amphibacillus marinus TaxID=872970 RepID=A0A1H8HPG5_9BACI|nr:chemotaxis protein CheD [Amphibacillus marinus]SEN57915.1 chemotaxis protein CheD [Amphibacillus marinus]
MKTVTGQVVKVGIADLKFAKSPDILRTSGLGSCVGVVIYDQGLKMAGMAHVMLPESKQAKKTNQNMYKYADTAIPILIEALIKDGARKFALKAKLAGGAQMFSFTSKNDMLRVGERNIQAVKDQLEIYRIPIISEDISGNSGRTIEFSLETCLLNVRTVSKGATNI